MRKIIVALLFVLCSGPGLLAQEQWQRTEGPVGTTVNSIIEFNGKIYAATTSGVFTSEDQGVSWQPELDNLYGGIIISSFATDGEKLIGACFDGVLYRTATTGWQQSDLLEFTSKVISNGNVFLAKGYSGFDLYRSDDGIHWNDTGYNIGGMGTSGTTLFIETTQDLLRSEDGLNWEGVNLSVPGYGVSAIAGDGEVVLLSRYNGGVYRSTDNGSTFTQVDIPTGVNDQYNAYNFSFLDNVVYASINGQVQELFYSEDHGLTWQKRNPGHNPSIFGWGGLIVKEDYQLLAASEGIYRSTNGGATWDFDASNGLANATVNQLLFNQGAIHALTGATLSGSFGIYTSADTGENWEPAAPQHFGRMGNVKFGVVVNGVMLVQNNYTLSRSTDNGMTWQNILSAPSVNATSMFVSGSRVLMGTDTEKIYYSDDAGLNWTQAPTANLIVNCFTVKEGTLYSGAMGGIQKSTDNGTTWTNMPSIIAGPYDVINLTAGNEYIFAAVQAGGAYIQLYRSADNGETWQNIHGSLPEGYWFKMAVNGNTVLVGTNPPGDDFNNSYLYKSTDSGLTWQQFEQGMFVESDITYLGYSEGTWWAGTESAGLWKVGEGALGADNVKGVHNDIVVYPNPVQNVATVIVPQGIIAEDVLLYDLNGRIVRCYKPQTHPQIQLEMNGLESGMYLLKLETNSGILIHKVYKQ